MDNRFLSILSTSSHFVHRFLYKILTFFLYTIAINSRSLIDFPTIGASQDPGQIAIVQQSEAQTKSQEAPVDPVQNNSSLTNLAKQALAKFTTPTLKQTAVAVAAAA